MHAVQGKVLFHSKEAPLPGQWRHRSWLCCGVNTHPLGASQVPYVLVVMSWPLSARWREWHQSCRCSALMGWVCWWVVALRCALLLAPPARLCVRALACVQPSCTVKPCMCLCLTRGGAMVRVCAVV